MQAIRTRYHGPSNVRGSCIRAKCEAGSVVVSYDYALNIDENHKAAAAALRAKLGWDDPHYAPMHCGFFDGDGYHVFEERDGS